MLVQENCSSTRARAFFAIAATALFVVGLLRHESPNSSLWIAAGWSSWLYEIVPGFILASLATWLVSLGSPGPSADIDMQFDAAAAAAHGGLGGRQPLSPPSIVPRARAAASAARVRSEISSRSFCAIAA